MIQPFTVTTFPQQLKTEYLDARVLRQVLPKATREEKISFIRLWASEGIPFCFRTCPMLYEACRSLLATRLSVHAKEITLIGSARLGFSLTTTSFGRAFDTHSDLDFTIVSHNLFAECAETFRKWKDDFNSGRIAPNKRERRFWVDNALRVPENITNGFVDPYKIPLRSEYQVSQKIASALWFLGKRLELTSSAPVVRSATIRVYDNWYAFVRQNERNLELLINGLWSSLFESLTINHNIINSD